MSDFINSGWALYVAGITIGGLVFCAVILLVASKRKVMANDNTTGHVWDEDLRELNNPLPRWWMGLFVITIVFAVAYLALYPGLGTNQGVFGWTSRGQWEAEQQKAREAMQPVYAKFTAMSAADLAKDTQAMGIGERLFVNNCAQCHGANARGSKGFPNLTDGDWLGGSGPEYIEGTVTKGRQGVMPPIAAAVGGAEDVKAVANYVLSLSGSPHDAALAEKGKDKFAVCAACHGPDGKGMQTIGSPNLTDRIWLHGPAVEATITGMVNNGKTNIMPPFEKRLSPEQIHVLAAYVWNLSQASTVAAAK